MAAIRMGIIYSSDSATDEEKKNAVEYFKKASDREFLEGMYYTGAVYQTGIGVKKNYDRAILYYKKAADKNMLLQ